MAHAEKTGGLMELGDIKHKLIKSRGRSAVHQVSMICKFLIERQDCSIKTDFPRIADSWNFGEMLIFGFRLRILAI